MPKLARSVDAEVVAKCRCRNWHRRDGSLRRECRCRNWHRRDAAGLPGGVDQPRSPSSHRGQLRTGILGGRKQETRQNLSPPVWAAFSAFRAICVPNVAHSRPKPGGVDQPRSPSSHRGQLRAGILGGRKQETTQNFSPPVWAAFSAFRATCVPNVAHSRPKPGGVDQPRRPSSPRRPSRG